MMLQPFYFGDLGRETFGILHPAQGRPSRDAGAAPAWLVCPPLLQDAIRSHRALWTLAGSMAGSGHEVLRFDWYGTGDSAGDCTDLSLAGMLADIDAALATMRDGMPERPIRLLALRSAALPVLAHAAARGVAVDLVLWQPWLDGAAVVADWRRQQVEQLSVAGRYPYGTPPSDADELMGFTLDDGFLDALSALDLHRYALPRGSRVVVAQWEREPIVEAWRAIQEGHGVEVDDLLLDNDEAPPFDEPRLFEAQAFPRQSVATLSGRLVEAVA